MTSQKIGAFLLQIVFFLTDFAEFRVKLVFCIQAEIIISSISKRYPTVERRSKVITKIWVFRIQISVCIQAETIISSISDDLDRLSTVRFL